MKRMTIEKLIERSWYLAEEKGWHSVKSSFPEHLMLVVSELSEALEEYRNGHGVQESRVENGKPEGVPIELADALIRIFDMCGVHGIDIAKAIEVKHKFNETRPYRHGGKVI
jgi:NTP pyrophosphatase (non-canonical NTP hydrolase)